MTRRPDDTDRADALRRGRPAITRGPEPYTGREDARQVFSRERADSRTARGLTRMETEGRRVAGEVSVAMARGYLGKSSAIGGRRCCRNYDVRHGCRRG